MKDDTSSNPPPPPPKLPVALAPGDQRILQYHDQHDSVRLWFIPQWYDGCAWHEFFGFDPDSPYLHMRVFASRQQAETFLLAPSVFPESAQTAVVATRAAGQAQWSKG